MSETEGIMNAGTGTEYNNRMRIQSKSMQESRAFNAGERETTGETVRMLTGEEKDESIMCIYINHIFLVFCCYVFFSSRLFLTGKKT